MSMSSKAKNIGSASSAKVNDAPTSSQDPSSIVKPSSGAAKVNPVPSVAKGQPVQGRLTAKYALAEL